MLKPDAIYRNSRFFENLLEHRFVYDLGRYLVLAEKPRLLNVLKSEVDAYGFDFVLTVDSHSVHVQMKTRSGKPPASSYHLSEGLWQLPNACVIWMLYERATLEPKNYYLLGCPMRPMTDFRPSNRRSGHIKVPMQKANHKNLSLSQLVEHLFPEDDA